jgi:hypothetical protein
MGKAIMNSSIYRTMLDGRASWVRAQIVATFPIDFRSDGTGAKTSAAIRANIIQDLFDAATAESAFKRANHRFLAIWWKRRVTVLAGRS